MSIANMKVATKLGLGFGVVLLLMVMIIITGITKLSSMNQTTEELVKDRYHKTVLVNAVTRETLDNGRSLRNFLFAPCLTWKIEFLEASTKCRHPDFLAW